MSQDRVIRGKNIYNVYGVRNWRFVMFRYVTTVNVSLYYALMPRARRVFVYSYACVFLFLLRFKLQIGLFLEVGLGTNIVIFSFFFFCETTLFYPYPRRSVS